MVNRNSSTSLVRTSGALFDLHGFKAILRLITLTHPRLQVKTELN